MANIIRYICLGILCCLWSAPALPAPKQQDRDLQDIENEIADHKRKQQNLSAQADTIKQNIAMLRQDAITLAENVQRNEKDRNLLEDRLEQFILTEIQLTDKLHAERETLSRLFAALQSMETQPPPAFAVHPHDALKAIQGKITLNAIIPGLQKRAATVKNRLGELRVIRAHIKDDHAKLRAQEQELATAQKALDELLAQRAEREQDIRKALKAEQEEIARLAKEAASFRAFTRKLLRRNRQLSQQNRKGALFDKMHGYLRLPANGNIIKRFGTLSKTGQKTQGLSIQTRPGTQIIAPYDAKILYAGAFRQLGDILILSFSEDYQMVLIGLGKLQSFVGQNVLAGEPIAQTPAAHEKKAGYATRQASLYLEMRYKGKPIDPFPWIRAQDKG